jgi:signal transduction histidine kinase
MSASSQTLCARVLVVDDETALVTALLSTLRENGYRATGATSPVAALEHLRGERFDVILTDLHLSELDGIALTRSALEIDPTIIPILMTGHGSIDTAVSAMKSGAVDYVLKPFKLKTLQGVLARALAARQLRAEHEALQRNLAARTRELEAMNKELEAFSYSVSHDLRAPLRAIESFTTALLEESVQGYTPEVQQYGDRIKRNVRRMGTMIDDLLRMAKAARTDLRHAAIDLGELCREILEKLRAQAPERQVEIRVGEDLQVVADAGLLRIAMENLLGNAWKYTSRQPVARIEIDARRTPEWIEVHVRDNGVGFEMEEAGQLFTPFQRLRSGAGFEGTGVGLATVARIVQRHGGRIRAEGKPGRGATFAFTLPQAPAASAGDGAERTVTPFPAAQR